MRQVVAHLFSHEEAVRADIDDAALAQQTIHQRLDMGVNERFASTDGNHRRPALFSRAQTICETHDIFE